MATPTAQKKTGDEGEQAATPGKKHAASPGKAALPTSALIFKMNSQLASRSDPATESISRSRFRTRVLH